MSSATILETIRLFVVLVTAAAFIALAAKRVAVSYTVALVVFGLVAAALLPRLGISLTPELVLVVILPGLVFEAAYGIEVAELRRTSGGVALLAVPGVLVAAAVVAVVLHFATGLPLALGFVVGAMVAATDPVAVIAAFKALDAPRQLATLANGESLFNDGTGLVVFAIAVRAVGEDVGAGEGIVIFAIAVLSSLLIGGVVGFVASRVVATVDDHLIELTVSLATAYGTYLIADALGQSGVIATVAAAVVLGNYGRERGMSERTREAIDTVWEFVAFLLTALVFLLIGFSMTLHQLLDVLPWIAWGVVGVLIGRAILVYGFLGLASRVVMTRGHSGIPRGWLHVLFWAGLRGAVTVAMALSLPADFPQRALLQQITFGVVLFTLLVQAATAEKVVAWALHGSPAIAAEPAAGPVDDAPDVPGTLPGEERSPGR